MPAGATSGEESISLDHLVSEPARTGAELGGQIILAALCHSPPSHGRLQRIEGHGAGNVGHLPVTDANT